MNRTCLICSLPYSSGPRTVLNKYVLSELESILYPVRKLPTSTLLPPPSLLIKLRNCPFFYERSIFPHVQCLPVSIRVKREVLTMAYKAIHEPDSPLPVSSLISSPTTLLLLTLSVTLLPAFGSLLELLNELGIFFS